MKRYKMSKSKDRKVFRQTAVNRNVQNYRLNYRGGVRK